MTHVYTCYSGPDYEKLAQVWRASVKAHSADCPVVLERYERPAETRGPRETTPLLREKLRLWREHLRTCDEPVIFADADMLARADVTEPFKDDGFDLAYTVRGNEPGINGGIWWVHPSQATRWFFDTVAGLLDTLLEPDDEGEHWRHGDYGAVDQAAMWKVLTWLPPDFRARPLLCAEWNACQQHWGTAREPRVVHIKSELRDMVLGKREVTKELRPYVKEWKQYA